MKRVNTEREKKLEQSTQQIDKIYSKIEILIEIINRQIEQKIDKYKSSQIFKLTKVAKYKNGKEYKAKFKYTKFFTQRTHFLIDDNISQLQLLNDKEDTHSSL